MKRLTPFVLLPIASLLLISASDKDAATAAEPVPVDDSMHHLMEYVFEPAYKRLKETMAAEPADKAGWSAMKGDSLTLAESANLLLHRLPDEDSTDWIQHAIKTRKVGGDLYQAARKKDYAASKESFGLLLNRCNACHDQFADGEHQLKP